MDDWKNLLLGSFVSDRYYKVITETAMLDYLLDSGQMNPELIILSDAAGQFHLKRNASCWVHAERILTAIIPESDLVVQAKEKKLKQFWLLYRYIAILRVKEISLTLQKHVEKESIVFFDGLCHPLQIKSRLDKPLRQLQWLKDGLLIGIERTKVPLHNNQSESDIREFVIRRIVSGATKSHEGVLCRDTFTSLKKTAQRHQISFWE